MSFSETCKLNTESPSHTASSNRERSERRVLSTGPTLHGPARVFWERFKTLWPGPTSLPEKNIRSVRFRPGLPLVKF